MNKVLLVDDDIDLQKIYSEKLTLSGYKVFIASDSELALNILENNTPNIILLDIMIPGKMNGLELLTEIKSIKKFKNIPIIVLTNLDNQKEDALKSGANDYFVKANLSLNELVQKVKSLC